MKFAPQYGISLQVIRTGEMENPRYLANPANRCYYSKKALFEKIAEICTELMQSVQSSAWRIFYGVNRDNLGDFQPGIQAAKEAAILVHYVDLVLIKIPFVRFVNIMDWKLPQNRLCSVCRAEFDTAKRIRHHLQ